MKQRGQDRGGRQAGLCGQTLEFGMDLLGDIDRFHARGVSGRSGGFNRTAMNRCAVAMRNPIYALAPGQGPGHRNP